MDIPVLTAPTTLGEPSPSMRPRRKEIIALLRGQVACPVIASLAEFGWLDRMCAGSFDAETFSQADPTIANSIFKYLASLGLLIQCERTQNKCNEYVVSDVGRSVFRRSGSFCILNSYEEYFQNLGSLVFSKDNGSQPAVNRLRNVLGSGQLHFGKFFLPALAMVAGRSFPFVIDVGCGNGEFLQRIVRAQISRKLGGIDVSSVALEATKRNMDRVEPDISVELVECDARNVQIWAKRLPWNNEAGLLTFWFVLHEVSENNFENILSFLCELRDRYPLGELIIGEIVRLPEDSLAKNRDESIMPEFLFFHELSGQGVLSWSEWQRIRATMPFHVVAEHRVDDVGITPDYSIPSSFVWHLRPN